MSAIYATKMTIAGQYYFLKFEMWVERNYGGCYQRCIFFLSDGNVGATLLNGAAAPARPRATTAAPARPRATATGPPRNRRDMPCDYSGVMEYI